MNMVLLFYALSSYKNKQIQYLYLLILLSFVDFMLIQKLEVYFFQLYINSHLQNHPELKYLKEQLIIFSVLILYLHLSAQGLFSRVCSVILWLSLLPCLMPASMILTCQGDQNLQEEKNFLSVVSVSFTPAVEHSFKLLFSLFAIAMAWLSEVLTPANHIVLLF